MALTEHFDIPMPVEGEGVDEEFYRLQVAWGIVDAVLKNILDVANSKAPFTHTHTIAGVVGLEEALAGKLSANITFGLDDLNDVSGAAAAPLNYVLVKGAEGQWVPSTAIAALGPHGHAIGDITGLDAILAGYYTKTDADTRYYTKTEINSLIAANRVQIGESILWNSLTLPAGFLKENGAAVSRAAYPELFAAIGTTHGAGDGSTTFNLPDSRAEFFRGLDDGRGIDVGRVLGSLQAGLVAAHTHGSNALNFVGNALPAHSHVQNRGLNTGSSQYLAASTNSGQANTSSTTSAVSAGTPTGNITGTTDSFGGAENRPRNVSKLVLIRAF